MKSLCIAFALLLISSHVAFAKAASKPVVIPKAPAPQANAAPPAAAPTPTEAAPQPAPAPAPEVPMTCETLAANGSPKDETAATGIYFFNQNSSQVISVKWVRPDGVRQEFLKLRKGKGSSVNTFVGHLWVIESPEGKCLKVVKAQADRMKVKFP